MFFSIASRDLLICCLLFGIAASHAQAAVAPAPTPRPESPVKKLKLAPGETALYVADLHCKTCAKKIARKLYVVKGVMRVRTDVKDDVVIITPQKKKKLDVNAIWKAAQKSGFPPKKLIGPQGTYVANPKTKQAQRLPDKTPTASKRG